MLIDFCGFMFNGIHSSELNIIRTSNGSRYTENLGAVFQDKTAPVEGGDGTLFWNSYYTNKPFSLQFAFDSLTEKDLRRLRQVFCAKAMGELIFDETPYKAYTAKVQQPPQLNYVCFDNINGERIYKGEGTIQLISYYPYAKSVHKFLDEFNDFYYTNKYEWAESSGMARTKGIYDGTDAETIKVYNAGDIETDWQAFYLLTSEGCALGEIDLEDDDHNTYGVMRFSTIPRKGSDEFISLNSRTQLIEGYKTNASGVKVPTGTLYNEFFTAGEFFKIPLGSYNFISDTPCVEIKYTYLYY